MIGAGRVHAKPQLLCVTARDQGRKMAGEGPRGHGDRELLPNRISPLANDKGSVLDRDDLLGGEVTNRGVPKARILPDHTVVG